MEDEYKNVPMVLAIKEGFIEFLKSILCVVSFILLKSPFDNRYCITKEFGEKSMLFKVIIFLKIIIFIHLKFLLVCIFQYFYVCSKIEILYPMEIKFCFYYCMWFEL